MNKGIIGIIIAILIIYGSPVQAHDWQSINDLYDGHNSQHEDLQSLFDGHNEQCDDIQALMDGHNEQVDDINMLKKIILLLNERISALEADVETLQNKNEKI